jgi:branched-chain amino acid transport system ATP-binding protein
MATLLRIRELSAGYGQVEVLHGIDLDVEAGQVAVILGANGAGKTTTMRAISGMIPRRGVVEFAGEIITRGSPDTIVRLGIAQVPQGRGTFTDLTVEDNLRAGAYVRHDHEVASDIALWYETFPRLADRRSQKAGTLSGGEQQMLALARALAVPPKVIIADEMSLGLAPLVVDFVFENIQRASETGVTIVLIEQFIHRALGLADQCVILKQGSVAWTGPSDHARQEVLDRYLGESADAMS